MVTVPSAYVPLLNEMAASTGIPYAVEAAQANQESGFNATAVSSAGAEGWLQFMPSTYNEYAAQAGVPQGSEFNPSDEAKVYEVYMNALLKMFNGNVYDALEAYNAGFEPGTNNPNPAGASYAEAILSAAKSGNINVQTGATSATLDSFNPLGSVGGDIESGITSGATSLISGYWNMFLQGFKVNSLKDLAIRAGLILLGAIILLMAIHEFMGSSVVDKATGTAETAGKIAAVAG